MNVKSLISSVVESDGIFMDRHGSMPNRPKEVRFKNPEDYNAHMGFDASLPDDVQVPKEQIETVKRLLAQGYKITGHSKWFYNPRQVEILMTLRTKTGSRYADVYPNGRIA